MLPGFVVAGGYVLAAWCHSVILYYNSIWYYIAGSKMSPHVESDVTVPGGRPGHLYAAPYYLYTC